MRLVVLGLTMIFGVAGTIVTCALLWRRGSTPWGHWVYDVGVRRFGITAAILSTILFTYLVLRVNEPWSQVATFVGVWVAVGLPLCLWAGYWWGRIVAAQLGIKRTGRLVIDTPPPSNNRLQRAGEE